MQTSLNNKTNIKDSLNKNGIIITNLVGSSMKPFLNSKTDLVVIEKSDTLKKYDCILYERKDGTFILHRIYKVMDNYYLVTGDNQVSLERVFKRQILGKLTFYYRDEIKKELKGFKYFIYLKTYKIRRFLRRVYRKLFSKRRMK